MYLKMLEIQGFKSFPEKTVLTFGEGITAVVGPNGSGKSNIADAIRWVMGEQSTKSLRGSKMEDVIFGGTQKRKPLGYAEVSLVIDNADGYFSNGYSEVMITRRYYRSGESEYYINRQNARLKEINELFMDTGLGNEGYSSIGQGKIDEILAVKGSERREMFEAAAGISRFRHRKEEAERKLSATEENLVRIGDKIAELELSVGPLKEQSEKAQRYLFLRDELRTLEINLWLHNMDKLSENKLKVASDLNTAQTQLLDAQQALETLYREGEQLSADMRELDTKAEQLRANASSLDSELKDAESGAAVLQNELGNNLENINRIETELVAEGDRFGSLSDQINDRRIRLDEIEKGRSKLQFGLDSLTEKIRLSRDEAGDLSQRFEALRYSEAAENQAAAAKRAEINSLSTAAQELYDRDTEVRRELSEATKLFDTKRAEATACSTELKQAEDDKASASNRARGYELRLEGRKRKSDELSRRTSELKLEVGNINSRINMLRELERDYEGYSKAVKTVMRESQRGSLKNIHGPVSTLLKTSDEYTVALETALGGALKNIVVEREEDAKTAINMLKSRDGGRATFLPISAIKKRELNERDLEKQPGFVAIACELAEYDTKYDGIFRNLLGRTVIAQDLDSAIAIGRKYSNRFPLVTLDGQQIHSGGSMTGGSTASSEGILSRANELKRLEAQSEELQREALEISKAFKEAQRELELSQLEVDAAKTELREAENRALTLSGDMKHFELLLQSLDSSRDSFREELELIGQKLTQNQEVTAQALIDTQAYEASASKYRDELLSLADGQSQLATRTDGLSSEMGELKASLAALDAEEKAISTGLDELEGLRASLADNSDQRRRFADELRNKNTDISARISTAQKSIANYKNKISAEQENIRKAVDERLRIEGTRTQKEKQAQDKNREIINLERETARLSQLFSAAEQEETQLINKLWDSYELTLTAASALRTELESEAAASRRVSVIKKEISALGSPNLGAIEEYKRVSERYQFLTGQRSDIEKAKADLEKIIRSITGEMRIIFEREFGLISQSFSETFTEIFGGGAASLELEDGEDVLGSGIEIRAQLPGKQLKTTTLLSGGERAFVAIALYFSLLRVRPAPFCVMDEIDTALDEANVLRFARYLRSLSDKTQFIIITHHRGLMEEADVLYGVTMQEQGISRLLTVNLNELEKQLAPSAR